MGTMDKKEIVPPHVVGAGKDGAHDQAKPLLVKSAKGVFSGRPHPPKRSAASGGDPYGNYAAGGPAANEGGTGGATVDEIGEAVQPESASEQVLQPGAANAGSPAHRAFVVGVTGSEADRQHAGGYKKKGKKK